MKKRTNYSPDLLEDRTQCLNSMSKSDERTWKVDTVVPRHQHRWSIRGCRSLALSINSERLMD